MTDTNGVATCTTNLLSALLLTLYRQYGATYAGSASYHPSTARAGSA